jgi:hypothetical protein
MQPSQLGQAPKPVPLLAKSVWHCISLGKAARIGLEAIVEPKQLSTQAVLELVVEFSCFHSI